MTMRAAVLIVPLVFASVLPSRPVRAQDSIATPDTAISNAVELMRANVRAKKSEILGKALNLPDSQASVFWPLYRKYEYESSKLMDERVKLIHDYAAAYDAMND